MTACVQLAPPSERFRLEESDVIGEWIANYDGHVVKLRVAEGGLLEVEDFPLAALRFHTPLDWDQIITSTGDWKLESDAAESTRPWFFIQVRRIPGEQSSVLGTQLFATREGGVTTLLKFWGEPETDPPIEFTRVDEP
jgi:hypothetical protein